MNYQELEGIEASSFALVEHIPDDSGNIVLEQKSDGDRSKSEQFQTWNWTEAAAEVGVNESTLRKVWWEENLEPAFRYCPDPLRVVVRTVKRSGRQIEEFTATGIQVLKAYKAAKEKGDRAGEIFLAEAKAKFSQPEAPTDSMNSAIGQSTKVAIEVETGNHNIVVPAPVLPQSYTLEGLREIESIEIEDPLSLANQFLAAADLVQDAMQRDIEQREQKLQQTRRAKTAITAKAQELKLEQRLYRERANQISVTQTEETQALQDALSTLQGLGKSTTPSRSGVTG